MPRGQISKGEHLDLRCHCPVLNPKPLRKMTILLSLYVISKYLYYVNTQRPQIRVHFHLEACAGLTDG